jgi:hypothetical protein
MYFENSNSNINFIDNNDLSNDPHSLSSAGGLLSLRSQYSQQYPPASGGGGHHSIKTVASK